MKLLQIAVAASVTMTVSIAAFGAVRALKGDHGRSAVGTAWGSPGSSCGTNADSRGRDPESNRRPATLFHLRSGRAWDYPRCMGRPSQAS